MNTFRRQTVVAGSGMDPATMYASINGTMFSLQLRDIGRHVITENILPWGGSGAYDPVCGGGNLWTAIDCHLTNGRDLARNVVFSNDTGCFYLSMSCVNVNLNWDVFGAVIPSMLGDKHPSFLDMTANITTAAMKL